MLDIDILRHSAINTAEEFLANIIELNTLKQLSDFYPYLSYCSNKDVLNAYLEKIRKLKRGDNK